MNKFFFLPSSFRDKSGRIFQYGNRIFRTVNKSYKENYDFFINSGLFKELVKKKFLVNHLEIHKEKFNLPEPVYKVLEPQNIPFISYSYEWSFDMLWQAASLTLSIQKIALSYGMSLKDASAFNVQFIGTNPVFIDTLSFEKLPKESPWIAYRQFCSNFLAPLALAKYKDLSLNKLQALFLEGIPLELVVKLLPWKSYLNFHLFLHLYLHNFGGKKLEVRQTFIKKGSIGKKDSQNLIASLNEALNGCRIKPNISDWSVYYQDNNYSSQAFEEKTKILTRILKFLKPKILADLGSNTGLFSRVSANYSEYVVSIDFDPASVNENFLKSKKENVLNVLPLFIDLNNPSPGLGWQNSERDDFIKRLKCDCILALALIHHLYFSNNLSFSQIADFLRSAGRYLIIEFIPYTDTQIKRLIGFRTENFGFYNEENFKKEFGNYFKIKQKFQLKDSKRVIYLMESKNA